VIDTHCHLTFPDFAGRIDDELAEAARMGVTGCITISTTSEDCLDALAVARRHSNVWCTAGIHPLYADKVGPTGRHLWANLAAVAADPRCVGWGELGLDNHYDHPTAALQREVLDEQLAFIQACEAAAGEAAGPVAAPGCRKPIVLHCREAFDDLIPVLARSGLDPGRFVFHCFTGSPSDMRKVLDFGAMVSFTGVVTYRNAAEVREAARLPPDDRLMVETDAPFLSPEPHRGRRPCRPAWARHVAETLAALRAVSFEALHEALNRNTRRFFGVPA
jgi:TatD DNase family protein